MAFSYPFFKNIIPQWWILSQDVQQCWLCAMYSNNQYIQQCLGPFPSYYQPALTFLEGTVPRSLSLESNSLLHQSSINYCYQFPTYATGQLTPNIQYLESNSMIHYCDNYKYLNFQNTKNRYQQMEEKISNLYSQLYAQPLKTIRPILLFSKPCAGSLGLEEIWNNHFELLFQNLPCTWSFGPATSKLQGWNSFRDMAKVRFLCQQCRHGWTSMHGLVVFYFRHNSVTNSGDVRFILMGQKCSNCDTKSFETPMWYPEEAQKVMTNIYHEIASKVFNFKTPPKIKDRRHGRPRHVHNSDKCEGCQLGVCLSHKD